ncbi:M23 family metallopeptidase [Flavobacterium sp. J49]|uniref:M23 family metallopeptidase n=1 Tax=Flavobacterium sp. J49 TaxID=2718534 RepID=UPI001594ACE1|nr:M23 family metallopeptidase [Flavobacterium sp. J49]MBF6641085.1 M23 family metallopeptidase [Flavobacterium sp. J49]NIC02332.1 M23 family metallopeptidase [Flavobacterium sp. J49]
MKFIWLFCSYTALVLGQNQYPKDYFRSPLDIPLQLSGNFGELRPNHFHSGFDFKTQKKEGFKVYAVADGYVSRIKIAENGYGKAIYITHPNGYTSVYGHLQSGFGEVEKLIKREQYKAKSYEIDLAFAPTDLLVKKDDVIAISGNTGGSDGPHLHFEIRDTKSEKIINPLYFGFDSVIKDTKKPILNSLYVYPLDNNSVVNQSKRPIAVSISQQADGSYIAEKVLANGKIGFGITAIDYDDVSWNANGIFRVQTFLNGKADFSYKFDTFAFDETRYINALIDYGRYKKLGQRVQKLFVENPFSLSIIQPGKTNGIITLNSNFTQNYKIEIADFNENLTKVFIPIEYSVLSPKVNEEPITSKYLVKANKENVFSLENVTVSIPANTFLKDFYMDFEVKNGLLHLHDDLEPAFTNMAITFEDSVSSEKDRQKMFVGSINGKKIYYYNTKRYKNSFTVYSKYLGDYKLFKDSMPPKVKIDKKIGGQWISQQNELIFTISDDLSGIKSYEGTLNGKWILLEYEPKTKKLIHRFSDGIVAEGKNDLKLIVKDNVGNSTIFETQFFRSQKP